jgi:16S rRNA (uracil1498-N3)-methyltransferase
MPAERFFHDALFSEGKSLAIGRDEAQHLRVMRIDAGDQIELVNGKGQLAKASIITARKDRIDLLVESVSESSPPKDRLVLCLAIPLFNRLEWVIEKGTELGVAAFWLFPGDLSEKKTLSQHQSTRLHHLSIAALKQCGRLDLPPIECKEPLAKWSPPKGSLLFGDTDPNAPPIRPPYPEPIYFFSGPEKGFSRKETASFHDWNAKGVSLNRNILRADTAPIVAAAILVT